MAEKAIVDRADFKEEFTSFLCDSPLYTIFELSDDVKKHTKEKSFIESDDFKADMYCTECKKSSTFFRHMGTNYIHHLMSARASGVILEKEYSIKLACSRNVRHTYRFSLLMDGNRTIKIGQFPSMESIGGSDLEKYRPVLEKEYFSELRRAGGLASHGMGIAPYVYLRRIFERLIFQHYVEHQKDNGKIEGFETMRIEDKISALSNSLPTALIANKAVYKILSKGIHELDEDSCLKYYPVVRAVIVAILEEDLQRKAKAKAEQELSSSLSKALSELKALSIDD